MAGKRMVEQLLLLMTVLLLLLTGRLAAATNITDAFGILDINLDLGTRHLNLTWRATDVPTGALELCVTPALEAGQDCYNITTEDEAMAFPLTSSGFVQTFAWLDNLGDDDELLTSLSIYVPWHLHVAPVTADTLLVSWDRREAVFVTEVSDINEETKVATNQSINWLQLDLATTEAMGVLLHNNFQDDDTPIPVTTIRVTAPAPAVPIISLPWTCDGQYWASECEANEVCVPATQGFFSDINPADQSVFHYTCLLPDETSPSSDPPVLESSDGAAMRVTHAAVMWVSDGLLTDRGSAATCFMRSAASIIGHACNGRTESCVISPAVATFAWHDQDSVECRPDHSKAQPLYEVQLDGEYSYSCPNGLVANNRSTCFSHNDQLMAFEDSRSHCLEQGGDLPFFVDDLFSTIQELFPAIEDDAVLWTLGTSDFERDFFPYTWNLPVTASVVSASGCYPCTPEGCPDSLPTVCVFSEQLLSSTTDLLETISCEEDLCENEGTCYAAGVALGEVSTLNDTLNTTCSCPSLFYGQYCQYNGVSGEEYDTHNFTLEEGPSFVDVTAPTGLVLLVEFAHFGSPSLNCFSPAAMSLVQLRCNGRESCQISLPNLRDSLRSTCPRIVADLELNLRVSYHAHMECSRGTELDGRGGCYAFTTPSSDVQELMEECNSAGGDLSPLVDTTEMCQIPNSQDKRAAMYSSSEERVEISLLIGEDETGTQECGTPDQSSQGMCEFPKSLVSNVDLKPPVNTVTGRHSRSVAEQVPSLTAEWEAPSPDASAYSYCLEPFDDACGSHQTETTATFDGVATGVNLTLTIQTHYDETSYSVNNTFYIFIPQSLSLIPVTTSSVLLYWGYSTVGNVTMVVHGSDELVPKSPHGDLELAAPSSPVLFSLLFEEDQFMEMEVEVEVQFPASSSGDPYTSPAWQCVAQDDEGTDGCPACTASLITHWPDLSRQMVDRFYETCHQQDLTSVEVSPVNGSYIFGDNSNQSSATVLSINYVQYQTSEAGCQMHSAQALLRHWCHGLIYCSVSESVLRSYVMNSLELEQDCTPDPTGAFKLFVDCTLEEITQRELSPNCRDGWELVDETCFGLSPQYSFVEAREWCQQEGGDLADVFPSVQFSSVVGDLDGSIIYVWVKGESETQRSVTPYIPTSGLQPTIFSASGVESCSTQDLCQGPLRGLCSQSMATDDVVSIESVSSSPCQQNTCVNGGTCWSLQNDRAMCDCPEGFYGDSCEDRGNANTAFRVLSGEYGDGEVLTLQAPEEAGIYVEFAQWGMVPYSSDTEEGCLSTLFLQILQTRCNDKASCGLSHQDIRHQLLSDCPRMLIPEFKIRYSYQGQIELCEVGNYNDGTGELPAGCYDTVSNNNVEPKQACLETGGDLVYSTESLTTPWLCEELGESAYYSRDYNFWESTRYSSSVISCGTFVCDGQTTPSSSLCVYPVKKGSTMCERQEPFPDVYPGYFFPNSQPGLARTDCPTEYVNEATWKCGTDGLWFGTANLTLCKYLDLTDDQEELASENRNRTAAEIVEHAGGLANNVNVSLAPGDVIELSDLMIQAQDEHQTDINNANSTEEKLKIAELMINSTAALSDTLVTSPDSWVGMPPDSVKHTVTGIQRSVSEAAVMFASLTTNTSRDINETALQIRIMQHPRDYYTEERRTYRSQLGAASKIVLPENFYEGYEVEGSVAVVFASYDNLHCLLNGIPCQAEDVNITAVNVTEKQVNSYVIGADVGTKGSWDAVEGYFVEVTFSHVYHGTNVTLANKDCSSWNTETNAWSTDGCELVSTNNHSTTCQCTHLTNLAVIMDINGVLESNKAITEITKWVTLIGCPISIACLAVTALVLLGLEKIRKRGGSVVRANICINLMMAELLLLAGLDATGNKLGCAFIAAFLHYFFLATFAWSALESFNLYLALVKVFGAQKKPSLYYYAFGYGVPLLFVSITLGATQGAGYGTDSYCWLDSSMGLVWAFAGPLACILSINIVGYGMMMKVLWVQGSSSSAFKRGRRNTTKKDGLRNAEKAKELEHEMIKKKIYGSIAAFFILGITWITGFFYLSEGGAFMAIPFTLFNAFQGVVIFMLTVLRDDVIKKEVRKKLGLKIVGADGHTITSSEFTSTRTTTQRSHVTSKSLDF